MSCNYADGLSPYENKGVLGLAEKYDSTEKLKLKCDILTRWINDSRHVVVHTGAGISTSAGISDFRGPSGVWTLERKGLKPEKNIAFDEAVPTKTHMALKKLIEVGKVQFIISQNIDGLHLRSGVPRSNLAELHGNIFIEQCNKCNRQFIRDSPTPSVGKKSLAKLCFREQIGKRPCRGQMHDTILDWEHQLPDGDLALSDYHSSVADLSICLGTSLQIVPSANLPLFTKNHGGRLVICNLQSTKHDKQADLVINGNVDDIFSIVMGNLQLQIPNYDSSTDVTKNINTLPTNMEWTISLYQIKKMKELYKSIRKTHSRKKNVNSVKKNKIRKVLKTVRYLVILFSLQ